MEKELVQKFINKFGDKFDQSEINNIGKILEQFDQEKLPELLAIEFQDPKTMQLISIFGGWLGVDRFMLDDERFGILKILTFGGLGVLTVYDWITIKEQTKKHNLHMLKVKLGLEKEKDTSLNIFGEEE